MVIQYGNSRGWEVKAIYATDNSTNKFNNTSGKQEKVTV